LTDSATDVSQRARAWYEANGKSWEYLRQRRIVRLEPDRVLLEDGNTLTSATLAERLRKTGCYALILAAFSAGQEPDEKVASLWDDAPDEAYALDAYASAVVEQQVRDTLTQLNAWAQPQGIAVLPHYSPGYTGWDLADQAVVLASLRDPDTPLPGPLELLPSGMLRPRKSMLAVFGLTRVANPATLGAPVSACGGCDLAGCDYRRAGPSLPPASRKAALHLAYPEKALARWARDLLCLEKLPDGRTKASFRYEGSTCSNMGSALVFLYEVVLQSCFGGHSILSSSVKMAGHARSWESMCAFKREGQTLIDRLESERPFDGWSLDRALSWNPDFVPSGCLCTPDNRHHKWRIVLHTIRYGLREHEEFADSYR
jgi:hypothetical protein